MNGSQKGISREQVIALRNGDTRMGIRKDYWSKDDRELLKMKFLDGDGITEIALAFKRTETAIVTQLNYLGMFERSRASRKRDSECLCPKCKRYPDCEQCRRDTACAPESES